MPLRRQHLLPTGLRLWPGLGIHGLLYKQYAHFVAAQTVCSLVPCEHHQSVLHTDAVPYCRWSRVVQAVALHCGAAGKPARGLAVRVTHLARAQGSFDRKHRGSTRGRSASAPSAPMPPEAAPSVPAGRRGPGELRHASGSGACARSVKLMGRPECERSRAPGAQPPHAAAQEARGSALLPADRRGAGGRAHLRPRCTRAGRRHRHEQEEKEARSFCGGRSACVFCCGANGGSWLGGQ